MTAVYNPVSAGMLLLWQDLRYGARLLLRKPGFAAVVVAVLALGIGANSAVFSVVNAVLLRPLPYSDPERLYRLDETNPKGEPDGVSPADLLMFQARTRLFEAVSSSHWENVTLTGREGPENVYGGRISAGSFAMLGSRPALGRLFRADEFRPEAHSVVVLSDRLWKRRFGRDRAVVGTTLMLNGRAHTVIGVMGPDFFFDQRFELWTPWQFTAEDTSKRESRTTAAVRLAPGIAPERAQAELATIFGDIAPEDVRKGWSVRLTPMARQLTDRFRQALVVSLGAVALVLLIACLNVASLLLVRAADRQREIAVRAALGAGRLRVFRQMLTESLLLAAVGGAGGLLLGTWGARMLVGLFPDRIPLPRLEQTRLDGPVLLFTFGVSALTGVLFGLVPALRAATANLYDSLKESVRGTSAGTSSRRLRCMLVIAETALSLILLMGAGLMLRSLDRLMRVNPGFDAERVLTMRVPLPPAITDRVQQRAYYSRILERLRTVPGLKSAGLIAPLPLAGVDANCTFAVEGRPLAAGEQQLVKIRMASPEYFRAMGIALLRGRLFNDSDTADAPGVAVVSESLVRRYFPEGDPIGRRVTMSAEGKGPFLTVIGVVNDVNYLELGANAEPEMYRDYRQFFFAPFATTLTLRTRAEDPMQLAALAQREIRAVVPDQPVCDLKTMRMVVSDNVSRPRFYTLLLAVFAAIAVVLAATGLYGVLAQTVRQRAREIGIRLALGAPRGSIFRLVLGQALLLAVAGVVLGIAGSLALTRLLAAQLYQTAPGDAGTFVEVSGLMLAIAAVSTYLPARRAVRVDPATALHFE
jgi:predicted permease